MTWTDNQKLAYAKCAEKRLREMQENPHDRAHGTPTGYKYGCRCFKCRKAMSDKMHAYYIANRDRLRAADKAYYEANKEKHNAKRREYYRLEKAIRERASKIKGGLA